MKHTNALINEDSPYLLQHAHNPFPWQAWGEVAFEKALSEDKLIFLSIGYSTCHWCHVMERETFENEAIANEVARDYVCIKVDREELPHVDKTYQDIHYLLTRRSGGWPLSIIMTPRKEVIFAATYLPPNSRNNMMGFSELSAFISKKYKEAPHEVAKSAQSIKDAHERFIAQKAETASLDKSIITKFLSNTKQNYDDEFKGIGSAPKFPHASTFDTLLDIHNITDSYEPLLMVLEAYEAMAKGGIYDQIEGGFYRYSVDAMWLIPHFEKMLYTNAELVESYSKLYASEKNELFKEVVVDTIGAMKERFLKEGVFYSASDADSEGVEGKYFVFTHNEASKVIDKEALEYFGITKSGNFEHGYSNPVISSDEVPKNLLHVKRVLKDLRSKVTYPFIDFKVLTSWNALMLSSMFEAGKYVDEKFSFEAIESLEALLKTLHVKGVLYHQFVFGASLKIKALLEDYAFLIDTLLKAYEFSFEKKYLNLAYSFTQEAIQKFYKNSTWQMSDDGFEANAVLEDSSYKSALSKMLQNIAIVSLLCEDEALHVNFEKMLASHSGSLMKYPHAYCEGVKAVLMSLYGVYVIKTSKENLLHVKSLLKELHYPYIYVKESNIQGYEACSLKSCFYVGESLEELKSALNTQLLE